MFCGQCGSQNPEVSRFCSSCGSPLVVASKTAAMPPAPPVQAVALGKPKGAITLDANEQANLLFEPDDFFEVLSGTISFTSRTTWKYTASPNARIWTKVHFFFDAPNSDWGTREWTMSFDGELPNGPALLVLYCRGTKADAFGIVSMVNRAWTHLVPLDSSTLIKESSKGKRMGKDAMGMMLKGFAGGLIAGMLTGGLATRAGTKAGMTGPAANVRQEGEAIAATIRSFMYRLAQNADKYWQGGGNSTSGRL